MAAEFGVFMIVYRKHAWEQRVATSLLPILLGSGTGRPGTSNRRELSASFPPLAGARGEFCYPPPMGPARHYRFAAILVACIAFLSLRLVGEHLHFCFDGSEPPVSVHGDDGDVHHADLGMASPHDDADVDLMIAVFKGTADAVLPLALLGALLLILPLVRIRRVEFPAVRFSDSRFHSLRPPLRGPPR